MSEQSVGICLRRSVTIKADWLLFFSDLAESAVKIIKDGWVDGGVSGLAGVVKAFSSIKVGKSLEEKCYAHTVLSFAWSVGSVYTGSDEDIDNYRNSLFKSLDIFKNSVDSDFIVYDQISLKNPALSNAYQNLKNAFLNELDLQNAGFNGQKKYQLDVAFNKATFEIWARNFEDFKEISEFFQFAPSESLEFDLCWKNYRSLLTHNFDVAPVFGQTDSSISMSSLYVPLRGFWIDGEGTSVRAQVGVARLPEDAKIIELDSVLDQWIEEGEDQDWLRLIGGGPGSGKSTTLKALARRFADRSDWRPLFVPLQHIGIDAELRDSINRYFQDRSNGSFTTPPLARSAVEAGPPLLLIFDGLDELIAPRESAGDAINLFSARINTLVASLRGDGNRRLKVVISGRMPAFQAASRFLNPPKSGRIEALGYLPIDSDSVRDRDPLWRIDQRPIWWKKYAQATGLNAETPPALEARELEPITHEPLLCYLLVLAGYATKDWKEAADNPNRIYSALIRNIYDRGWGEGIQKRHGAGKTMLQDDFLLLMETIGLAAWLGGDSRVATEESFLATLKLTRAELAWDKFKDDNGPDVTNLAMNFYLKSSESYSRGFEFTHKSFGEYLASRALISIALETHDLADRRIEFAMKEWINATKTGKITREILKFIRDEIRLQCQDNGSAHVAEIVKLKVAFTKLAEEACRGGFPMSAPEVWRVQEGHQVNGEHALWAILNGCALAIARYADREQAMIVIKWPTPFGLGTVLNRLAGGDRIASIFPQCLSYVDLRSSLLFGCWAYEVNFEGACLDNCIIDVGKLYASSYKKASLNDASFYSAYFEKGVLDEVALEGVRFVDCRFSKDAFIGAKVIKIIVNKTTLALSEVGAFSGIEDKVFLLHEQTEGEASYLDDSHKLSHLVEAVRSLDDHAATEDIPF